MFFLQIEGLGRPVSRILLSFGNYLLDAGCIPAAAICASF
jgi:hypothetical protein